MNMFEQFRRSGRDRAAANVMSEETHRERVMTDDALRSLGGSMTAPADLQLRLRVALSHERVRQERQWLGRLEHRMYLLRENTLRPFAVQGAMVAAALLVVLGVGVTLGAVTPGQAVEANDVPLIGFSAPRYLYAAGNTSARVDSADQTPLMVEARVNSIGHVYDYRVLSGTLTPATEAALRERMLNSVFTPASFFGEPVRGTAVLTFADVEVHG